LFISSSILTAPSTVSQEDAVAARSTKAGGFAVGKPRLVALRSRQADDGIFFPSIGN
jgi:hypothetical protein